MGATAEPPVSADAVDYRALNPPAREGFKWNSFRRVETRGGVEEAYPPVSNEVIELDTAAEPVGSVLASDRSRRGGGELRQGGRASHRGPAPLQRCYS